mgnify:CR=1 FL=1
MDWIIAFGNWGPCFVSVSHILHVSWIDYNFVNIWDIELKQKTLRSYGRGQSTIAGV